MHRDALEKIEWLEKKIKGIKEKIALLSKDSSTSSKPPSSDIVNPRGEDREH